MVWIFNNASGWIQGACTSPPCGFINGRLLSGYISFATGPTAPGSAESEAPPSPALAGFTSTPRSAGIAFMEPRPALPGIPWTPPPPTASPQCYYEALPPAPAVAKAIAYYCLVYVHYTTAPPNSWGARTELDLGPTAPLASSIADTTPSAYRVCRYTAERNHNLVGTGTPPLRNGGHPYDYKAVRENLVNQNFLVIRAGDGVNAFDCPDDTPLTPLVNGRTWHHQPAS